MVTVLGVVNNLVICTCKVRLQYATIPSFRCCPIFACFMTLPFVQCSSFMGQKLTFFHSNIQFYTYYQVTVWVLCRSFPWKTSTPDQDLSMVMNDNIYQCLMDHVIIIDCTLHVMLGAGYIIYNTVDIIGV